MRRSGFLFGLCIALAAVAAQAQMYRWTDEKGRVHITDTPPPPGARSVQKKETRPSAAPAPQTPFELSRAMRDFPVTLYSSPACKEGCAAARAALNKRGVPFKEVQVWDEDTVEMLKRATGGTGVPAFTVGSTAQRGFEQGTFDALLDSAGYPKAGALPPRAQAAPPPPEGYGAPESRGSVKAEPLKPEAPPPASGPYAPRPPAPPPATKK